MLPARARRISLLGLTLALLSAGSVSASLKPPAGETPDPNITDGTAQHALDTARAAWKKAGIHDYNVRIALSCFCAPAVRKPTVVKVRGSVPVKPPDHLKTVASVGRMFRVIQGAIKDGVAMIGVSYGTYGVPKTISIDVSRQIADEESYYKFDRFKRVH